MKKRPLNTLIKAAGFLFLVTFVVIVWAHTAFAQSSGPGYSGSFSDVSISYNSSTDQLLISGEASITGSAGADFPVACDVTPPMASGADSGEYYVDGDVSADQAFRFTEVSTNCSTNNPFTYVYSFSITDTDITPLAPGEHTVTLNGPYLDQDNVPFDVSSPAPTVSLTASPSTITLGSSTALTITTTNASSCIGSGTNDGSWNIAQATSGTVNETPSAAGTATFDITCTGPGGSASDSATVIVTSSGGGGGNGSNATGTIVVTSENANNASTLVNATWAITGNVPGAEVCEYLNLLCYGTKVNYSGLPVLDTNGIKNSYTMPTGTVSTNVPNYSFRSMEEAPIAVSNSGGILVSLRLAVDNIFSTVAQAFTISPANTQELSTSTPTGFTILWNPDAVMQVSPGSFTTTWSGSNTDTATVTNTGAPYSTLTWTASANTTSGGNWLVAPSGDSSPGITNGASGNSSDAAVISFDASVVNKLATGQYTGAVIFTGYNRGTQLPIQTVNITLIVSPPPTITGVTVVCTPSSIPTDQTSACTPTVTGTGSYSHAVTWSISPSVLGSINQSTGVFTAGAGTGDVTVTATSNQDPTKSGSAQIVITPGSGVTPPSSAITGVTVACNPTSTPSGQTSSCVATVTGTGAYNAFVTWSVGPSVLGTIAQTGPQTATFTAAAHSTGDVTVTATSNQDPTKQGSAQIIITPTGGSGNPGSTITGVQVLCSPTSTAPMGTSLCNAVVTGTGAYNAFVTWSTNFGSVDNSGNYTAPGTTGVATITATSNQDPTKSDSATVNVVSGPSTIGTVSVVCTPASTVVGGTSSCVSTVTGTGSYSYAVTWSTTVGSIDSNGNYTAPAFNATAVITATSNQDTSKSGSASVVDGTGSGSSTITGVLATCNPNSIYTNGTSTCTATVYGTGSYSSAVTWSTTLGSIDSNGNYTAPPGVTGNVVVTATSQQDTTQSNSTQITISSPLPQCSGASCPICQPQLSANPSSIVVPDSSDLQYSCQHITSCTLTGTDNSTYTSMLSYSPDPASPVGAGIPWRIASGTQPVTPSLTTTYTLDCTNANYGGSNATVQNTVQVSVGGLGRCEQNPNGAGCPGAQ